MAYNIYNINTRRQASASERRDAGLIFVDGVEELFDDLRSRQKGGAAMLDGNERSLPPSLNGFPPSSPP
eukprot:8040910-Pyramimonas_sp.AAC.1